MFSVCFGKYGGYVQFGDYDGRGHLGDTFWVPFLDQNDFRIGLAGMSMNDHFIHGSQRFKVGFIDSGTTFAFLPVSLYQQLRIHFDWFCAKDGFNCKGIRSDSNGEICFKLTETTFMTFYESFPIIRIKLVGQRGILYDYNWYPSEYFYLVAENLYCLAAKASQSEEIIFGTTMIR